MIIVTRKDSKESLENLVRRFGRKVQQSGLVIATKQNQYFEKPMSKRDRRAKAIVRRERKNIKAQKIKLGRWAVGAYAYAQPKNWRRDKKGAVVRR